MEKELRMSYYKMGFNVKFDIDEKTDGLVARGVHIVHNMHVITALLEYEKYKE